MKANGHVLLLVQKEYQAGAANSVVPLPAAELMHRERDEEVRVSSLLTLKDTLDRQSSHPLARKSRLSADASS